MQAAEERAARSRAALLLFFLAAVFVALPATASLPSASSALAEPEPLVLEDLADELASYQAEACAAQIAALTAPPSRSFELFPPRVRAALEESLPRLEWRVSPKSRVRGFDLAETLQVSANQWFRPKSAVGVLFVRNRYLDPETGRFISTDPLEYIDAPSLYQYSMNSTPNVRDPFGLDAYLFYVDDIIPHAALYVETPDGRGWVDFGGLNERIYQGTDILTMSDLTMEEWIQANLDQGWRVVRAKLKTTSDQDARLLESLGPPYGSYEYLQNNCATAIVERLKKADLIEMLEDPASLEVQGGVVTLDLGDFPGVLLDSLREKGLVEKEDEFNPTQEGDSQSEAGEGESGQ